MRRLLLATLLASVAAPLAAVEYVAVGDSVTAGSSYPAICDICPVVFDCNGFCNGQTAGNREFCGYVYRLDDWIAGWAGPGDHVSNQGIGGETTMAAVYRLPGVLDSLCPAPGDCNAVLLMHGTNDMGAVSPESVRNNLAMMIAEAKSRKIDTVLMSIIRKGYDPLHETWQTYRDLTAALAADESLVFADPFAFLCPNDPCFSANYWLIGEPPCYDPNASPDPGHPDPDGYEILTDVVKARFPGAVPAAPAPTAPSGDITDTQPDFVWSEAATARWYQLEVDGASTWWETAAVCSAGTCTVDPGVTLAKGAHAWRVRGRNLRGMGSWSATTNLTVWGIPGQPTPSKPTGLFFDATPTTAPFGWEPYEWSAASEATDYDLVVYDGGTPVVMRSFPSSICAGTCMASPGESLAAGNYTWTVQARNPAASGAVSGALAFEIYNQKPDAPTPTAPTGDHYQPFAPLYRWLAETYATEYDLEVRDSGGNLDASAANLLASTVCSGGVCSYQGGALSDPDVYTLTVLGRNDVGTGPTSMPGLDFTVLACADPSTVDLASLQPSPVTTTEPPVSHCGPITAASAAAYTIEATGDLTVITRDGFSAFDGLTVFGKLSVRSP